MAEILVKRMDDILMVSFNRPEKMNAITRGMYSELNQQFREAAGDFGIRVLVIHGEGEHFTAGNDILDFAQPAHSEGESESFQFIQELHNFAKPIVAIVQGNVIGIGATLLLHCDLVVASPEATFALPFVSLGLVPEAGSSYLLPALVGYQRAAQILLLGESFTAKEAKEMGLVGSIKEDALAEGLRLAKALALQPPAAVINTKALLKSRSYGPLTSVIEAENELFKLALQSDEAQQAFARFISKRIS